MICPSCERERDDGGDGVVVMCENDLDDCDDCDRSMGGSRVRRVGRALNVGREGLSRNQDQMRRSSVVGLWDC